MCISVQFEKKTFNSFKLQANMFTNRMMTRMRANASKTNNLLVHQHDENAKTIATQNVEYLTV